MDNERYSIYAFFPSNTKTVGYGGKPRRAEDPGSLKRIGKRGRFGRVKLNPGGMVCALLLVRRSEVRAKEGEPES